MGRASLPRRRLETGDSPGALPSTGALTEPDRIELLDVLRGFAIFGIVLFNLSPSAPLEE